MKWQWEWWHHVVAGLVLLQLTFFVVPQFRPGVAGWVCWVFGSDRTLWPVIAAVVLLIAVGWSLFHRPLLERGAGFGIRPFGGARDFAGGVSGLPLLA